MNRALFLGIAMFFAIVGLALVGGDNVAQAGRGCGCARSCEGGSAGCHRGGKRMKCDGCRGRRDCKGCRGCKGRRDCKGHRGCKGRRGCRGCCGTANGDAGNGDADNGVPEAPEAASRSFQRSPVAFRKVSFRR